MPATTRSPCAPVDAPVHDPPLPHEASADGERLRAVMRHVASPVTVVTVSVGGEPRGATIGSFTSLSLRPPLVSFNVSRGSSFHRAFRQARHFAVHVLGGDQADVAEHFALPDTSSKEQFAAAPVRVTQGGPDAPPLLAEALAVILCERWKMIPAGDHELVIGRVVEVEASDTDGSPLVYLRRAYREVGG